MYENVFCKKTWKRFLVPMSVKLFEILRHRFTNVTGDQVHIYSLLPSCPTFLSCLIAKLLSLWTAPFVCTEWVLQCLLHKINSFIKTELHANSSIFCRVFTPALPLPFSTVVLNSRTASAARLLSGSDFSHILLHSMHVGRRRKHPYFSLM